MLLHKMAINASFSDFITKSMPFAKQDIWINSHITKIWNPVLNKIMIILTNIFSPEVLLAFSIALFLVFIHKKKRHNATILALSVAIGLVGVELIKLLVQRPRPENSLVQESGYSFPSTHSAIAIIFFVLIIYFFKDYFKSGIAKTAFIILNILSFVLVGFSRVYLNVHWFSDVIIGFLLGSFAIIFSIFFLRAVNLFVKNNLLKRH